MAISLDIHNTLIHVGDTIRVHYKIIEKEIVAGKTKREKHEEQKERLQVFEGICLAIRGKAENQNFIVRRIGVGNVGIERIFPVVSPWIKKVTVKKRGDVRRAKLYYLRNKSNKAVAAVGQYVDETVETKPVPSPQKSAAGTKTQPITDEKPASPQPPVQR